MLIPYYLQTKLATLGIDSVTAIRENGYLATFALLRGKFLSLGYQALFDLYCYEKQISILDLTKQDKQKLIQEFKALPPCYSPLATHEINYYLSQAEEQAKIAGTQNEVPIGAIITYERQIIAAGYNQTRCRKDIFGHAELEVIRQAQSYLDNYRLENCDLYVTIEPCLMCSGAILHSRIRRLIYGASEPKTGACQSQFEVFANKKTNHHCQLIGPVDQTRYSSLISSFFRNKISSP